MAIQNRAPEADRQMANVHKIRMSSNLVRMDRWVWLL